MPSIRSGFGSDFVLKSEKIGIGSETPINTLDVGGAIKGNLSIAGVATLTSYGGFVAQNQHINKASSIGFGTVGLQTGVGIITSVQYYETETGFTDLGGVHHGDDQYYNTLSEDLVIDEGQILNITSIDMVGFTTIGEYDPHSHQSHVCLGALEEVSVTNHFSVPCGGSNDRKDNPIEGTVRFNDDLNTLEFFNGNEWRQFTYNQGQSGRAVFGGGIETPSLISYINISSTGNALNFGTMFQSGNERACCSNATRGLFNGGGTPGHTNVIEYITIASAGNGIDFGDATADSLNRSAKGAVASSTRAVWAGGWGPGNENIIEYVEINTVGNALDFGDLAKPAHGIRGASNGVRGIYAGGYKDPTSPSSTSKYEYIVIASKGNALLTGELINRPARPMSFSNSIRGVWGGGANPTLLNAIQYLTISSLGNALDFGELTQSRFRGTGVSSQTRGVFVGGAAPSAVNIMDYITISTQGNAIDFGDIETANQRQEGCSDSHGGLGGF